MNKRGYFHLDKKIAIIIASVILCVGIGLMFILFGYEKCEDWECFNDKLSSCHKARFIGGSKMIFEYTIKGSKGDGCEVGIELLQGELNNQDSIKLEKHKMKCILPKGVVMIPESDVGKCHGLLKEGLQDLVIKKFHSYIVQNLGKINLEIIDIPTSIQNQ